jgi:hypothetical protein
MSTPGSRPTPQAGHFPSTTAPRLGSVRELDETASTCRADRDLIDGCLAETRLSINS